MAETELIVNVTATQLVIDNPDETVLEVVPDTQVELLEIGIQGPAGANGGGLAALENDTSPSLGGDLDLGSFNINGQLENTGLIIDGGLL